MKSKGTAIAFLSLFAAWQVSTAQNPLIEDIGMSDPHARVFNDTLYLYTGHDSHPDNRTWVMRNWRVFSTTDLINWTQRATISPEDNYMDDDTEDCWAGDAASRNGKYYFYFSDRKRGIGVMTADSPVGPFKGALGKPLVSPMHDPTLLIDDDPARTPYLVYGDKEGGGFHICRLNEDMISLAEKPKPILIRGEEWKKAPRWMDKNYIFKYKGTYYLSWGRDYAISEDIYGPYECVGAVGNGHHLNEFAHGSFFWWKGQFYHVWCYYLRQGFKYRETIITYCHFDDEGHIVTDTDFLDRHFANGVGQYDAAWPEIEAEWYYEASPGIEKKGSREEGFRLAGIRDGSWVRFANTDFGKGSGEFEAAIQVHAGEGVLEIRTGSPSGTLLGQAGLEASTGPARQKTVSTKIADVTGKKDLYLKFAGDGSLRMELDFFRFRTK